MRKNRKIRGPLMTITKRMARVTRASVRRRSVLRNSKLIWKTLMHSQRLR
jgi:hypothetical protein